MSLEETEEQRQSRLEQERQAERNKNKAPPKKRNDNSNELQSGDEDEDDNDNSNNDNKDDALTTNGLGVDPRDNMDGLEPPLARVPGHKGRGVKMGGRNDITGKKRQLVETDNNFDELTKRFLNKEISEKNYMAIIETMKTHGSMGKNSGGGRSRRAGGKRSSIVCLFFPFFLFCFCLVSFYVECSSVYVKFIALLRTFLKK